jgi:hypothetical protein
VSPSSTLGGVDGGKPEQAEIRIHRPANRKSLASHRATSGTNWKPIAILLAILLAAVLIFAALLVAGLVDLGFSLF